MYLKAGSDRDEMCDKVWSDGVNVGAHQRSKPQPFEILSHPNTAWLKQKSKPDVRHLLHYNKIKDSSPWPPTNSPYWTE